MADDILHRYGYLVADWFDYNKDTSVVIKAEYDYTYQCDIPDKNGVIRREFIPKNRVEVKK